MHHCVPVSPVYHSLPHVFCLTSVGLVPSDAHWLDTLSSQMFYFSLLLLIVRYCCYCSLMTENIDWLCLNTLCSLRKVYLQWCVRGIIWLSTDTSTSVYIRRKLLRRRKQQMFAHSAYSSCKISLAAPTEADFSLCFIANSHSPPVLNWTVTHTRQKCLGCGPNFCQGCAQYFLRITNIKEEWSVCSLQQFCQTT